MDDRISSLPDEIICHIGSFLSAKEVAFTTVLSKRWRSLLTIIQNLSYDHYRILFNNNGESFMDFLDRVFALRVTSRVRNFSLDLFWYEVTDTAEYDDINRCLCHVLKLGVLGLELNISGKEGYSLPLELFTCETVEKLTLGYGFTIDFLPENACLPALKRLKLASVQFHDPCAFNTLLSVSPVLEELDIYDFKEWKWPRTVSSPTIKRLKYHHDFHRLEYDDGSEYESISFDTPALTYLYYSDWAQKEYQIVNLNSLVEVMLDIRKVESILPNPINLINGLKNVEILSLTNRTMELIHDFLEAVPMFENLSHLTLWTLHNFCWFGLQILLEKTPKLKTLTIEGFLHSRSEPLCKCLLGYSFLLKCRIEVLKITVFEGGAGDMLHLKHILEKLPYLALLEIHIMANDRYEEMKIKKDLLTIARALSKCEIQVHTCFAQVCDEKEEEEEEKAASRRCEAIPKIGLRCKRNAAKGSKWCWQHN